MALSASKKALCNKLKSDYGNLTSPAKGSMDILSDTIKDLKGTLTEMEYSDNDAVSGALWDLNSHVQSNIPNTDELGDIKDFIDNCDYLEGLSPVSAIIGAAEGISGMIADKISDLASSVPEIGAGNLGSLIDQMISMPSLPGVPSISDQLGFADKLLNCLSSLCAAEDPIYIDDLDILSDDLNGIYDEMGIEDDPSNENYGKFKINDVYDDVGMDLDQVNTIAGVKDQLNTTIEDSTTQLRDVADTIKNESLGDGMFA